MCVEDHQGIKACGQSLIFLLLYRLNGRAKHVTTRSVDNPIKCIIFDFDGVLVDSKKLYVHVIWSALKTFGEYYRKDVERQLIPSISGTLSKFLKKPEELAQAVRVVNEIILHEENLRLLKPCMGVPEIPKMLSSQGSYNMGLLTNSYRIFLEKGLARLGLEDCFEWTIAADDGFESKQDGCFSLIKHFRSSERTTLYIGDTNHDVEIARDVGCRVAIVLNPCSWMWSYKEKVKKSNPDYILPSLNALPNLLETLAT